MLAEFGGKMVECEEELVLPWGPRVLIQQAGQDPKGREQNRQQLLAVCAEIQQRAKNEKGL